MKIENPFWYIKYFVCGLIFLGSIAHAMVSAANTLYVATSGNDAVSCAAARNISTPKRTINSGMACMAPGDTLYIRAGTYTEKITWSLACTAAAPCTMAGYPGDTRPVLLPGDHDAMAISKSGGGASYLTLKDFDINGINQGENRGGIAVYMSHTTIQNLLITNISRTAIGAVGKAFSANFDGSYLTVRNTTIKNCGRIQPFGEFDTKGIGIYPEGENTLIEGNLIDGCRAGGIEVNYQDNKNIVVRNNIIRNAGTSSPWGPITPNWSGGCCRSTNPRGITVGGSVNNPYGPTNNHMYNNIMYNITGTNNQGRCFSFWGAPGQNNLLANNTCYNSNTPYSTLGAGSHVIMQNNIFAQMTTGPAVNGPLTGTISNNLTNPNVGATFVNAAGGDFHLKLGSAAINAGVTIATVTHDYNRVARPQDGAYDIGAYEYVGQPAELVLPPKHFRMISNGQ
jgi:Right handed beta helix region